MRACPASGASSPMIRRMVVDLPEPLGPRKPVTMPARTSKLNASTATVEPYRLVSPRTSIIATSQRHASARHGDHATKSAALPESDYPPSPGGGFPPGGASSRRVPPRISPARLPHRPSVAPGYTHRMSRLEDSVDRIASGTGFSGVVRVDRGGAVQLAKAYGLAHRGCHTANTVDTRFAIASGTKGLTALTVMSLIEEGRLEPATTEQYLRVLGGHLSKFAPDERFSYSNGGYVVLALIAERASGTPFHELVQRRVCGPAGMHDTEFLRSDELPGRVALGYLGNEGLRTNVFHLPVRGSGDGGIYSTAADVHSMWAALFAGRIVSTDRVREMVRPRSQVPSESTRYGLGFWLHQSRDAVMLEGSDAGVSFRTVHDPAGGFTHTVLSNTTSGAWPVARHLGELLTP